MVPKIFNLSTQFGAEPKITFYCPECDTVVEEEEEKCPICLCQISWPKIRITAERKDAP